MPGTSPGMTTKSVVRVYVNIVIARSACDDAIQAVAGEAFWTASRSLSPGRASRGPVGAQ